MTADDAGMLRTAAERLLALATRTTPGDWRGGGLLASRPEVLAHDPDGGTEHVAEARAGTAAWIVALSPAVAGPLAGWLSAAAAADEPDPGAVALARVLLARLPHAGGGPGRGGRVPTGRPGYAPDMSDDVATGGFSERLGARPEAADDGSARISFEATEEHLNPAGTLHGGVLATLVDTAMGLAVRTTTSEGEVPATSQLTVTYLRPGKPGPLQVTARLRTRGEHLTVCEADVQQDGKDLVHAVATFALLDR